MKTILIGLLAIVSIIIIVATSMMEPKTQGMGGVYGQDTNSFGTSAHQSKDKMLNKVTIICAIVFMVALIATHAM